MPDSLIKSLPLTTLPPPGISIEKLREKAIAGLEEQKQLVKDPNYKRTVMVFVTKDGKKMREAKQQRIRPWWRRSPNGTYAMGIPWRRKLIEFQDGNNAMVVPSLKDMPAAIDTLITVVRNGELDIQLTQGKSSSTPKVVIEVQR